MESTIYSYSGLYTKQNDFLLAKESSILINIYGGPLMDKSPSSNLELFDENVIIRNGGTVKLSQIFDHKYNRNNYIVRNYC